MARHFYSTMDKGNIADMQTMVMTGKPNDGGLYMPTEWNKFTPNEIKSMKDMGIQEIGYRVGKKFFGGDAVPDKILEEIAYDAFNFDVPIEQFDKNMYLMRLDQGPTGAFKDFAARYMGHMLNYFLKKTGKNLVILTATSGDTGSAIAQSFYGMDGIKVHVMYPVDEITDRQAMLMDTLGGNIESRAVKAKFDDLQKWSKQLLKDQDLDGIDKNTANSIHLLRLLPQTIYHLYGSSRVRGDSGVVVKADACGNFGNITADIIAEKYLGNPVGKIIAATNENDEFPVFMSTGHYSPISPSRDCKSSAMNVGNPSNILRLFDIYGGKITEKGEVLKMPDTDRMRKDIFALSVSDKVTLERIDDTWKKHKIPLETHGAVATEGAYRYRNATGTDDPILITETAAPWKFNNVLDGLGVGYETPQRILDMEKAPRYVKSLPGNYDAIKNDFIETFM